MMQSLKFEELKEFLDEKVEKYNQPNFIENDPIQIPHQYTKREDVEISAFLTATIAWGRRDLIIKSANRMMELMDYAPFDFITQHDKDDLLKLERFVHRTFNGFDFIFFIQSLRKIYETHGGMENVFYRGFNPNKDVDMKNAIGYFNHVFFENSSEKFRTRKHVANPLNGSAAKRLVMFLRWMVRKDNKGVDFGLWNKMSMAHLSCPLDIHTGNVGRSLGLITRKQNDWQTVQELDASFRKLDSKDPSKYDFALFGLGAMDGWK